MRHFPWTAKRRQLTAAGSIFSLVPAIAIFTSARTPGAIGGSDSEQGAGIVFDGARKIAEESAPTSITRPWRSSSTAAALIPDTAAPPATERRAQVLTLQQALDLALEHNRSVSVAALEVGKADDQIASTKTRRYPSFTLEVFESKPLSPIEFKFDKGAFGTFPGIGPVPGEDTTIEGATGFSTLASARVSQPLSQLYKIDIGVTLGEIQRDIAGENARSTRLAIANGVRHVYYGIAQAQDVLAAKEASRTFYSELRTQIEQRVEQQTALAADALDVKAKIAGSDYDVLVARHTIKDLSEQLNVLLGRDVGTPFAVEALPEPGVSELDEEAATQRALERNPDLQAARLKVRFADYDRRLSRAQYIPDLSLTVSYVKLWTDEVLPSDVAAAGLYLSWEPVTWGRRRREEAEKAKSAEQATIGEKDQESAVLREVGTLFRKLAETRALIEVAALGRDAAREKARLAASRYAEQAALLEDVLLAQAAVVDADAGYQQALAGYWSTRADFEKVIGEE